MAKQNEQKKKHEPTARQGRAVTSVSVPSSAASAKVARNTKPLPPLEAEYAPASTPANEPAPIPEKLRRRQLLLGSAGLAATALTLGGWFWYIAPHHDSASHSAGSAPGGDQFVIYWNQATLDALRAVQAPLPVAARALSMVHTSMFDAWAAYDNTAVGTRLGATLRRPAAEQTLSNKCQALSFAAYRVLVDLFPGKQTHFQSLMSDLRYNPVDHTTNPGTPTGIGNLAARALLDFRQDDGSNQSGKLAPGAYADYTHYQPRNTPEQLAHPNNWQPLNLPVGRTGLKMQRFACAQWANVTPFALASALQFIPRPGPPHYPGTHYTSQATQMLQYSAGLTDEQKVIAEYWAATTDEQILARWFAFAHFISQRDNHTLDQNVRLFFSLANAGLDTSIACWACKRAYDSEYPVTAIHSLFKDKQIHAWAGTGKDLQWFNGQYWQPYQPATALAPAYPEYCSEQSAFSAAAAEVLRNFTGNDTLGTSYTQPAHSSAIESTIPARPITLSWRTLSQAADQAGMAGRYGGIHFPQSDLDGRLLGSRVAAQVWRKAQGYINGNADA